MSTAASSTAAAPQLSEQQATQRFQALRSEMTGIAQKIGEIESEGEEHRAVVDTLKAAQKVDPTRKCFRLIGGVLVERSVADVVPALEANLTSLRQVLESLVAQYKGKEEQIAALQKQLSSAA
ncbi:Prefoldin beta-like protein [Tilletiopsis washingtonensis]|uniref:Prefoldin beta-like protein n=1 Tax=Tilletiopsis washingtonensis TaxID=58919 RepID=A0A316ZI48_9BASI|nr:Prefoldin beta-like protein [Tilletiopsis washingtonensis]PWO00719.1 Prefoldin beta-like protein [Tilletiopsis washingtonensis]